MTFVPQMTQATSNIDNFFVFNLLSSARFTYVDRTILTLNYIVRAWKICVDSMRMNYLSLTVAISREFVTNRLVYPPPPK